MKELETAWANAYSFTEKNRPDDMKYIGKITKTFKAGRKDFLFYKDKSGNYWYESRNAEEDKKLPA